jgi:hypothetical protein
MNPDGGKSPQGPPEESFRPGRETFGKEATVLGLSIHGYRDRRAQRFLIQWISNGLELGFRA